MQRTELAKRLRRNLRTTGNHMVAEFNATTVSGVEYLRGEIRYFLWLATEPGIPASVVASRKAAAKRTALACRMFLARTA